MHAQPPVKAGKFRVTNIYCTCRPDFAKENYGKIGGDTNQAIYRGVGNKEVGQMLAQYMPDFGKPQACLQPCVEGTDVVASNI